MNGTDREEAVMDARIMLEDYVRHGSDGWQSRYSESIDAVAKHFGISQDELSAAYLRHYGPSTVADLIEGWP